MSHRYSILQPSPGRTGHEEAKVRECWNQFQSYMLDSEQKRATTRRNYLLRCQRAHRWLRKNGHPGIIQANAKQIRAFWDSAPNTPETRNCYRSALVCFYRFVNAQGWRPDNPGAALPTVKPPKRLPRPIAAGDAQKLLDMAEAMGPDIAAMVNLMLFTGIRNAELRGLKWSDIDGPWMRIEGKGGKVRDVPIPPPALLVLNRWRMVTTSAEWVFSSSRSDDKPLPNQTFNTYMQELRDMSAVEFVPHQLRHTYATEVYEKSGSDILLTQQALGHSSPTTTAIYAKVRPTKLEELAPDLYR